MSNTPLPQITTQQLEYLVAVGREPTWASAAKHLQVTPSALSQGLAELERRVGLPLFTRLGRRRVLTNEGRHVLAYATSVSAQTSDLQRWAKSVKKGHQGTLLVGMIDAAVTLHYPKALQTFREHNPDVNLHVTVAPSAELARKVQSAELSLAIIVKPVEPILDCETKELLHEDLAIYAPPRTTYTTNPANWGPWVLFPQSSHTRQRIAHSLRSIGSPVEIAAESHQPDVLSQLVRLNMGWTVLPAQQAEQEPDPLLRFRPEPLLQRQLVILRRQNALPNPAATRLVNTLEKPMGDTST